MDKSYKKYGNCDAQKERIILDTGEITWGKIKEKAIQSYMETKPSSNRNSISKDYETQVCCSQAKQKGHRTQTRKKVADSTEAQGWVRTGTSMQSLVGQYRSLSFHAEVWEAIGRLFKETIGLSG